MCRSIDMTFTMPGGAFMKGYNVAGYALIVAYALACMYFAPPHIGPWAGLLIGAAYFVACWFVGGLYLSAVIHMGIAHRALDYKEWFVKAITVVNNTFGVYVESGHLGEPAPAAPQVLRPSRRSQQARVRRLLADAVSLPDALRVRSQHGDRRHLQVLAVPPGRRIRCSPWSPRSSISGCCGCSSATCASRP